MFFTDKDLNFRFPWLPTVTDKETVYEYNIVSNTLNRPIKKPAN